MDKIQINKWALFDKLGYDVEHPIVRNFHDSEARVKVVCAPRRGSKSWSAAHDVLPDVLIPNSRTWIVGPDYGLAEKEFRYIHQRLVVEREVLGLPAPLVCHTNAKTGSLYIKFPWGAIVEGKSATRPESLLGEAVNTVIYAEAAQMPRRIREQYVEQTLITTRGREIIPTTPSMAAEWVHELFMHGEEEKFSEIESFHWDITANPVYPVEELEWARKFHGEDSPVFKEQYLGEWVFYGGVVYPTFNPDTHVIEPFDIPKSWPRVRAIDFGLRDPFVCLWGAIGPEGEVYLYREYYIRESASIREHATMIKEYSKGEKIVETVGDPEAAQSIEDLNYEGLSCVKANNDRQAGRMKVTEYMLPTPDGPEPYPLKDKTGRKKNPRLYIFNTCIETLREVRYFRWKETRNVEGDKERTEGEDHAMDTLRYLLMTRPSPFRDKFRTPRGSFQGYMNRARAARTAKQYIGN